MRYSDNIDFMTFKFPIGVLQTYYFISDALFFLNRTFFFFGFWLCRYTSYTATYTRGGAVSRLSRVASDDDER